MQTMVPLYGFGGGGGTGATLTVNAPAGATVTVSKDGKSKTKVADSSGAAVFKGLATGEWTVTITDGEKTAQKTVSVTADYAVALSFSVINVSYPAGSVCTATDGLTTLTAPDTSGKWDCVVPNAGDWTLSLDNGLMNRVDVADGGTYTVNKWYLCKDGLMASGIQLSNQIRSDGNNVTVTQKSGYVYLVGTFGAATGILSGKKINMTYYTTVVADVDITVQGTDTANTKFKGVGLILAGSVGNSSFANAADAVKHETLSTKTGRQTISIDVSGITGSWYIGFALGYNNSNESGAKLNVYNLYVK